MRQLIAIPYPAPSIPAHHRLYHAGCECNGMLATHSRESLAYLGDYVYFATLRGHAQTYLRGSRKREGAAHAKRGSRVYVIDARALPQHSLVIDRRWATRPAFVEHLFFDLIDLVRDLRQLCEPRPVRGCASPDEGQGDVPDTPAPVVELLGRLGGRRVTVRQHGDPPHPLCLEAGLFAELVSLQRYLGIAAAVAVPGESALATEETVHHRFTNALLYLLACTGRLTPTRPQVREALEALPGHWLTAMARPVSWKSLPDARTRAETARAAYVQQEGIQVDGFQVAGYASLDGGIVLVPGPIPVLRRGWTGIDRSAKRPRY
jgi:hypothetical protein